MANESPTDREQGKELIRNLSLLQGLAEEDLEHLYEMSSTVTIPAGSFLMREGEPGDKLYVIIEGELEILKSRGAEEQLIATRGNGEVVGEIAVLQRAPRIASVRACRDSHLLVIDHDTLATLLSRSPRASLTILDTVVRRLRDSESMLMQSEKLASLGTMAAGLAHELNNPAAAIVRSADQLGEALADWERAHTELVLRLPPERLGELTDLRTELLHAAPPQLDPLTRSEREDDLQDWLEELEIEPAWELTPTLIAAGATRESLEPLAKRFGSELPLVVRWLAAGAALFALLTETRSSAEAISKLVESVKTYTFLDQAPVQEVDVHEGLENTLVVLNARMGKNITVQREYGPDLPRIEAYGSELNQVWTSIIDNALDAMDDRGILMLRTYRRHDQVVVELQDDGPGIPAKIRQRIFEPFFTTKSVGEGTGLGLYIAYDIVVRRHHGQLSVISEPGRTCFQVVLPIALP